MPVPQAGVSQTSPLCPHGSKRDLQQVNLGIPDQSVQSGLRLTSQVREFFALQDPLNVKFNNIERRLLLVFGQLIEP